MSEPSIAVSRDLEWVPYEPWISEHSTAVLGVLRSTRRPGDRGTGVSVVCAHLHPGLDELAAHTAWQEGVVYVLAGRDRLMPSLLVPTPTLTTAEVVVALDRAVRDQVL